MWNARAERASITIDAPIGVVWSVFTDVERWPTWASSFTSVELVDRPMRSLTRRYLAIEAAGLKQRTEQVAGTTITAGGGEAAGFRSSSHSVQQKRPHAVTPRGRGASSADRPFNSTLQATKTAAGRLQPP
jgi:polyketide cyclase/dehydrase/lipid transport protein